MSAQNTGLQFTGDAARSVDLQTAPEVPPVASPAGLVINRPTIPMADYVAAKNAAATRQSPSGRTRPGGAAPPVSSGVTLYDQTSSTNETQTTGGSRFPPDGDIATSASWMVQVNNDVITMLNWNTNALVRKKLSTFFSDGVNFLFDPRVVYDPNWDRFVVWVDGCMNCSTASNVSVFDYAVSKTGDPSGEWWVSGANAPVSGADFADFPQLGMDLHSIIVTFNDFPAGGGSLNAVTMAISKAYLYNGKTFGVTAFTGGTCTIAPPYVLDNSGVDYVMQFCPGASQVLIGSMRDTGLSTVSLNLVDNAVAVSINGLPPNAQQPGTTYTLDTGDNRFENRSVQVGSRILNVATTVDAGIPTPTSYTFDISASPHTLVAANEWFAAAASYDWHPSINANTVGAPSGTPLGEVFGTWMSTNPGAGTNVQLRAIGWLGESFTTGTGIPVFTSAIPLTNQTDSNGVHRSGDYSYIALYPAAALGCTNANEIGILEGETAGPAAGTWGTRIAIVKHC